jgi:hypothetical protein
VPAGTWQLCVVIEHYLKVVCAMHIRGGTDGLDAALGIGADLSTSPIIATLRRRQTIRHPGSGRDPS